MARRNRNAPVTGVSSGVAVVVKKKLDAAEVREVQPVVSDAPDVDRERLDEWTKAVIEGRTVADFAGWTGSAGAMVEAHPQVRQIWAEDVHQGLTTLGLAQWLKAA